MQLLSPSVPGSTSPAPQRGDAGAVEPGRDRYHVPGEAGIWIFIFGDMTLYALLSACFMLDRRKQPALFDQSANTLHTTFGAVNAFLLLASSLLVALGVRAAREHTTRYAPVLFTGALVCASGFVINKYFEYSGLVRAGHPPTENVFYTYYYVLTGIHLTHLLAGMCVLVYLRQVSKRVAPPIRAVESGASFWHVVDLLWMVLFSLLYLVR